MGREMSCSARVAERAGTGKAHLDSTSIRFTGALRFNVSFDDMSAVEVRGGALCFSAPVGAVSLELGPVEAEKWARAILHPKSRVQKLGLAPGWRVFAHGFDAGFESELATALGAPATSALRGRFDAMFAALESEADLARVPALAAHLEPHGALWLVYAKGKGAPLPERDVRAAAAAAGLVDVKVVSFSATHTAVKVVVPLAARGSAPPAVGAAGSRRRQM